MNIDQLMQAAGISMGGGYLVVRTTVDYGPPPFPGAPGYYGVQTVDRAATPADLERLVRLVAEECAKVVEADLAEPPAFRYEGTELATAIREGTVLWRTKVGTVSGESAVTVLHRPGASFVCYLPAGYTTLRAFGDRIFAMGPDVPVAGVTPEGLKVITLDEPSPWALYLVDIDGRFYSLCPRCTVKNHGDTWEKLIGQRVACECGHVYSVVKDEPPPKD